MKVSMRHDLPCTPDEFWEAFFDPDLNDAMYREAMGCTEVEITEQSGSIADGLRRTLTYAQPIDAPGPVKKVMGETAKVVETGSFADGCWTVSIENSTLGKRLQLTGTTTVEETDDGCARVVELDASIKIIGIGRIFEAFIGKESRAAQDATAEFLRARLA